MDFCGNDRTVSSVPVIITGIVSYISKRLSCWKQDKGQMYCGYFEVYKFIFDEKIEGNENI
jgi:hypothetical protein